jgi:LacI family transcriptional regulator
VNENYSEDIKKGLEAAANEYANYNFKIKVIETDISDPQRQIAKLKEVVLNKKPDGIIIIPQLKDNIKTIIDDNPQIQFMTLDIPIGASIFHVGSDYYKSGKITANILSTVLREKEKILVIDTKSDEISSKQYLAGVNHSPNGATTSQP